MSATLPRYRCHKEVGALKIAQVSYRSEDEGRWELVFKDESFPNVVIEREWLEKHTPVAGGYYVEYDDGYTSFSPGDVFEAGYTLTADDAEPTDEREDSEAPE